MSYIFLGGPEISVSAFKECLLKLGNPKFIITTPDKPKGRGLTTESSDLTKYITDRNLDIEIYKPERLVGEIIDIVEKAKIDFIIVVAYPRILGPRFLAAANKAVINLHPSLLPKYRGPDPIRYPLLNNDTETGVSIMILNEKMDEGPILMQKKLEISNDDNYSTLHNKLANLGSELLTEAVLNFDQIKPLEQNHQLATYTQKLSKEDTIIDYNNSIIELYGKIKAYSPYPALKVSLNDKLIKIIKVELVDYISGTKIFKDNNKLYLNSNIDNSKTIRIVELQPEGKKSMSAEDYIRGNNI